MPLCHFSPSTCYTVGCVRALASFWLAVRCCLHGVCNAVLVCFCIQVHWSLVLWGFLTALLCVVMVVYLDCPLATESFPQVSRISPGNYLQVQRSCAACGLVGSAFLVGGAEGAECSGCMQLASFILTTSTTHGISTLGVICVGPLQDCFWDVWGGQSSSVHPLGQFSNLKVSWCVHADHLQLVNLHTPDGAYLHPGCMSMLMTVGAFCLGLVIHLVVVLHAILTCAVSTFYHTLAGSGNMPVGLALEALRKVGGLIEDFIGVGAEVFQKTFLQKSVCYHQAEEIQMQC